MPESPQRFDRQLRIGTQLLRVGRHAGTGRGLPLLVFNGIGGNIELLEPLARSMPQRELITFDAPGVGHSPLPRRPYRLSGIARLAARVLDHYRHAQCDVLGVSWGGAAAQQFARSERNRCRRLILCATRPALHGTRAPQRAAEDGDAPALYQPRLRPPGPATSMAATSVAIPPCRPRRLALRWHRGWVTTCRSQRPR